MTLKVTQTKKVHPGLLWVEAESTAVKEDGGFEILKVSEAADSSFDGHDFAVHSFSDCIGDSMRAIAHNILQTFLDRAGNSLHRFQFCSNDAFVPVLEVRCC